MTTTNLIASLTVSELHFQTSLVTEYSLVEALSDAGVYMPQDQNRHAPGRPQPKANTVYLWEKGCQLFSGAWNCTTACTKASSEQNLVWNASHDAGLTYHNCLVYPIIAKSAAQNWLDEDSHKLLDKYGIVPDASLPLEVAYKREEYERAWPVINGCRRELCHELFPKMRSCPNPPFYGETGLKLGPPDEIWSPQLGVDTRFCVRGHDAPNSDIGGPGVPASYAQQLAIAILGWVFMSAPILYCATGGRVKPNAKGAMKGKLRRFRNQRNVLATVPALVDFHETQIFFSITLQIVCQVALSKAEKLEAKTAGELVANQFLIKIIGVAGIYPIVLNLCTLYRQKRFLDWFVLTASSCCVLMAVVTWSQAMSVSVLPYQLLTDDDRPPPGCGPANPMRLCISHVALHQVYDWLLKGRSLTLFDRVFLSGPPVALSIAAFMTLLATRIEVFRVNCYKGCKVNFFQWFLEDDPPKRPEDTQTGYPERAFCVLVAVWEIWLCFSTIMLLACISLLMVPVVRQQPKWSIGNIIAVAVWVPVTIKWFHMLWRGPEEGAEYRMTYGYVVKADDCPKHSHIRSSNDYPLHIAAELPESQSSTRPSKPVQQAIGGASSGGPPENTAVVNTSHTHMV